MDKEYLENIAGSSYVDESLGDKLAAKGMAGLQRFNAAIGGNMSDLNYTKIESAFNSFIKKAAQTLKPFAEGDNSISKRLETMRPSPNQAQMDTIKKLTDVYRSIVPTPLFQKPSTLPHLPLKKPSFSQSQLSGMLKEGIFSSDVAMKNALQSNDPNKVLGVIVKSLKDDYDNFIRTTSSLTNMSKENVEKVVSKLTPKFNSILEKVKQVVPQTATTASVYQPSAQPAAQQPVAAQTTPAATDKNKSNEFSEIVTRVIDIIIQTVLDDSERAANFFKKDLPTNWDQPQVTKDIKEAAGTASPDADKDEDDVADTGEFLYKFASKHNKHPGNYSVEVKPINAALNVYKDKQLTVIWNWDGNLNTIFVKAKPLNNPTEEAVDVRLFKFYDDQVDKRNDSAKDFSIGKLVDQADPNIKHILNGADRQHQQALDSKTDPFLRALYATSQRKAMEFKSNTLTLTMGDDGQVYEWKKGKSEIVPTNKIVAGLSSNNKKESKKWGDALEKIGFFKKHPEFKPKKQSPITEIPAALEAQKAIVAMGTKPVEAAKHVDAAIEALGTDATFQEYFAYATKKETKPISAEPVKTVTTPVSAPVSAPVSTDKPKPEQAKEKSPEVNISDDGAINYVDKSGQPKVGKPGNFLPPAVMHQINNNPDLKQKYEAALEKRQAKKKLSEDFINPFQLDNII